MNVWQHSSGQTVRSIIKPIGKWQHVGIVGPCAGDEGDISDSQADLLKEIEETVAAHERIALGAITAETAAEIFNQPLRDKWEGCLSSHYHRLNDPYQFARDNNLGLVEGQAVKYIARHKAKGGKRDLLACLGAVARLLIDEYQCNQEDALKVVGDVFERRGVA